MTKILVTAAAFFLVSQSRVSDSIDIHWRRLIGGGVWRRVVGKTHFLAVLEEAVVDGNGQVDEFGKRHGEVFHHQFVLDFVGESTAELVDQGGVVPVEVSGDLAEVGGVGGGRAATLVQLVDTNTSGESTILLTKGVLQQTLEGSIVVQHGGVALLLFQERGEPIKSLAGKEGPDYANLDRVGGVAARVDQEHEFQLVDETAEVAAVTIKLVRQGNFGLDQCGVLGIHDRVKCQGLRGKAGLDWAGLYHKKFSGLGKEQGRVFMC